MKTNHGHVVGVASILETDGLAQLTEYCSTKYAVNGFMQSLRKEFALQGYDGIHCTTVNPFAFKQILKVFNPIAVNVQRISLTHEK